jgi:REP element-mobilizing transposase RayT
VSKNRKTFFSDGYFVSSIGELNEDDIKKYIGSQKRQMFRLSSHRLKTCGLSHL